MGEAEFKQIMSLLIALFENLNTHFQYSDPK
jgi:hypothetical protein